MMGTIAPYWEGNETWLILIGAGFFAAFPMVYAIFLPAFYLSVALMLLAIVFTYALARHLHVLDRWGANHGLLLPPFAAMLAIVGLGLGIRRRRDGVPFVMAVLAVAFSFAASFWPYMIPYTVTVQDAAAPRQSMEFLFWGGGLVVFPVVLIYTGAVFWIFRGKVRKVARRCG
jgi:cytochrome d ubiquinol oxidase subunit II